MLKGRSIVHSHHSSHKKTPASNDGSVENFGSGQISSPVTQTHQNIRVVQRNVDPSQARATHEEDKASDISSPAAHFTG